MTPQFIAKRSKSISDQLDKIKDKMQSLEFELNRQSKYDLKEHENIIWEFSSAYIDVKEAIDKLDSVANYFMQIK